MGDKLVGTKIVSPLVNFSPLLSETILMPYRLEDRRTVLSVQKLLDLKGVGIDV